MTNEKILLNYKKQKTYTQTKNNSVGATEDSFTLRGIDDYLSSYLDTVSNYYYSHAIKLHGLDEPSGSVVRDLSRYNDASAYLNNPAGQYQQAESPDGRNIFEFIAGADKKVNLYSAAYNTNFNLNVGSMLLLVKFDSTILGTTTQQRVWNTRYDLNNRINFEKSTTANQLSINRIAAGTTKTLTISSFTSIVFNWFCISWDSSNDFLKVRYRPVGGAVVSPSVVTGNSVFAGGALDNTECVLGGFKVGNTSIEFDGFIALSYIVAGITISDAAFAEITA